MRKGVESKSVSAIVRQALETVGYKANWTIYSLFICKC